jgi:hypothetical protein
MCVRRPKLVDPAIDPKRAISVHNGGRSKVPKRLLILEVER